MEVLKSGDWIIHSLLFTEIGFFQGLTLEIAGSLLAIGVLLICSAFISGSEVAFFSIDPSEKKLLNEKDSGNSRLILKLLVNPEKLLATILISNNFINVAIVIISTYINVNLLSFSENPLLSFFIQVIAVTFLILLFGEIIPKVYATHNPIRLAEVTSYPISFLGKLLSPISLLLISSTSFIHDKIKQKKHNISVDELADALDLTSEDELEEEDILKGIVKFGSTDVKQIMKPRTDVTAIEHNTSFQDLIKIILDCGYSRIPVYEDTFDKILGILYIKDLLPHLEFKSKANIVVGEPDVPWKPMIRPPFFVPENKKIDDLLQEFQDKKIHLAVVVDEYGGTSGIVTLEDIIEEIVGEISDEYDVDELIYSKLDSNNYVMDGKTALNDLYRILDIDGSSFEKAKGESDSLAGFIIELEGRIPVKNEKITFEKYLLTVESADKRKVKRVKVTIIDDKKEV